MNLLEEVSGKFPDDKERIIKVIREYQALPDDERLIYRMGRRGGAYRSTHDLKQDPVTYEKLKNLVASIEAKEGRDGVERFIVEMVDQYV
jgi:hypothetical protein